MTVLQEILKWSAELPLWQRDALRRIVKTSVLTEKDLDDLTALAKLVGGLRDPQGRTPIPLGAADVPESTGDVEGVRLCALSNLSNVNSIASGQELAFAKNGLTVIYGDNGAGKSGYSRVLKRACRARDEKETVLPNANVPIGSQGKPSATFCIEVNNQQQEVTWREGETPPAILGSVAVFDSRCARIYIDDETDVVFVPYGLDIPERLVEACAGVKARIQTEASSLAYNPREFADLEGDTKVGAAVRLLPDRLDPNTVRQLGAVSEEDLNRKTLLEEALRQPDPAERIKRLERLRQRVAAVAPRAKANCAGLSADAIENARTLDGEWRDAKAASDLVAKALTDDPDLLPGTGGELWKKLFEIARTFSESCAYPGHSFPHIDAGARCPLCQEVLTDGAACLKRFDAFIKDKTELEATTKQRLRTEAIHTLESMDTSPLLDETTLAEVAELDPAIAQDMVALSTEHALRRQDILNGFSSGEWQDIAPASLSFDCVLERLNGCLDSLVGALRQLITGDREQLLQELRDIAARVLLEKRLEAVLAAIEKEKRRKALVKCATAITTTGISRKATDLTNAVVTAQLAQSLNAELSQLGFGYTLGVRLTSRTVQGATRHKLKLNAPSNYDLSKVLSEGEQRVSAIAAFLAEACADPGVGCLIFDDPVSSLDHQRRDAIAHRLIQVASARQVVLFTHDLYFLNLILHDAEANGINILAQMVARGSDGPGTVVSELPFQGKTTRDRIGELRQLHQRAAALLSKEDRVTYELLARDAYRKLRDTWERAVEEVLLNGAILRFRKSIETNRLGKVRVDEEDWREVESGMTKCSNHAHDNPLMAGIAIPGANELLQDIEAVERFRKRIEDRRQKKAVAVT